MNHNVRARVPKLKVTGIVLLVLSVALGAAANMIPFHVPTKVEIQREEQAESTIARRDRIEELLAAGDKCNLFVARELARALVLDGQSAVFYADDFERRCGNDHVVRKWGDASRLLKWVKPRVALRP